MTDEPNAMDSTVLDWGAPGPPVDIAAALRDIGRQIREHAEREMQVARERAAESIQIITASLDCPRCQGCGFDLDECDVHGDPAPCHCVWRQWDGKAHPGGYDIEAKSP